MAGQLDFGTFDLAGSLHARDQLIQQRSQQQREESTQNAFAQALPMLQTDPQNALATIGKTGNIDAYSKFSSIISQMDEQKKAKLAEKSEARAKVALDLQQYKGPNAAILRKAVLQSQREFLKSHNFTDQEIDSFDPSDQNLQSVVSEAMTVKEALAQQNSDRQFNAGRSDQADKVNNQNRTYNLQAAEFGEKKRHDRVTEAQDGGESGGGLDDAAKVNAAVRYNLTGILPPLGSGKAARQDRLEVLNHAALLAKGVKPEQLVANIANFKANQSSLTTQTKQFNAIETAANAAKNSANLALAAAEKGGAGPTGIPVLNKWIQAGRVATGDMNVKNLANHLDTFTEEYAKVMTGATGAGAATDSARQGAKERISKANNLEQLKSIIGEMNKEMGGRHYAARAQIQSIQGQLGGAQYVEPQGVQTAAPAASIPPPPPGFVVHP